ncbi:hypothetical protein D0C36_20170 [Mucilaginibacter conchicola]|uniref:Uncharacterized protein n=1 Tax=Mucilaginibacter conchicola TaxID=2303333 RepID=A0A372NQR0_9SPHI|nr:hypothetical protein [Mucilaginibacter conchicola]RFZ91252.1 hypothetical protein D0C36_20170 [Mucilaginibacter conchicola]
MKAALHTEIMRLRLSIRELQDMIDQRTEGEREADEHTDYIFEVQQMLYRQLRCLFLQIAVEDDPVIRRFDEKLFRYRLAWLLYTKGVAAGFDEGD